MQQTLAGLLNQISNGVTWNEKLLASDNVAKIYGKSAVPSLILPIESRDVKVRDAAALALRGREWDAALELYFYRARMYDSSTGRFLSEDPLGFAGGDANLFRYVKNSPLSYRDPSGRTAFAEDSAFKSKEAREAYAKAYLGCMARAVFAKSVIAFVMGRPLELGPIEAIKLIATCHKAALEAAAQAGEAADALGNGGNGGAGNPVAADDGGLGPDAPDSADDPHLGDGPGVGAGPGVDAGPGDDIKKQLTQLSGDIKKIRGNIDKQKELFEELQHDLPTNEIDAMGFDDFKADRLANLKDGIAENEALLDEKVQLFNELLDHFL